MGADIDELLGRVPTQPGVYLMKDGRGRVIYVGKAKDLRVRVRQYFRGGDTRYFVTAGLLARHVVDIETVVVDNEKEALLLENHLIKRHQPRFNVKLRDDSQYLVLRIDTKKAYPRVEVGRNIVDDGARYFGPYHSVESHTSGDQPLGAAANSAIASLCKLFDLGDCAGEANQFLANAGRIAR